MMIHSAFSSSRAKKADKGQDIEIYIQSAKHFFRPEHREEIDGTGDRHIIHVMTMFSFDFSNAFSQKTITSRLKSQVIPQLNQ